MYGIHYTVMHTCSQSASNTSVVALQPCQWYFAFFSSSRHTVPKLICFIAYKPASRPRREHIDCAMIYCAHMFGLWSHGINHCIHSTLDKHDLGRDSGYFWDSVCKNVTPYLTVNVPLLFLKDILPSLRIFYHFFIQCHIYYYILYLGILYPQCLTFCFCFSA